MTTPEQVQHEGDVGMSLVELLVTMVITGVLVPLVFGVLMAAQRQTSGIIGTADAVGDVQLAMATMGHQVRAGSGPVYVDSTSPSAAIGFGTTSAADSSTVAGLQCVQYRVTPDGALRTRSFAATPSGAPSTSWVTAPVVARSVSSAAPFATVGGAPGTVRVQLSALTSGGRTVSVDSSLTVRNTTTASTAPCGALS